MAKSSKMHRHTCRHVLLAASSIGLTTCALAQNKTWNNAITSGNWNVAGNWLPAAVPIANDNVNLLSADGISRTVTYAQPSALTLGVFTVNATSGGTFNLNIAQDTLSAGTTFFGTTGTANITQSGGTFSVSSVGGVWMANNAGSAATYNLQGGTFGPRSVNIGAGGTGTLTQSNGYLGAPAGTISVIGIGNNSSTSIGFYNISGGTANLGITGVNGLLSPGGYGSGTITQTGGLVTGTDVNLTSFAAGKVGAYNLSAGTLNAGSILLYSLSTGSCVFSHTGGTVSCSTLSLDGNTVFTTTGTNFTAGAITVAGGTLTIPTLNIDGVSLSSVRVGFGGVLGFTTGTLATSAINLSGTGSFSSANNGGFGTALLSQSGGTINGLIPLPRFTCAPAARARHRRF